MTNTGQKLAKQMLIGMMLMMAFSFSPYFTKAAAACEAGVDVYCGYFNGASGGGSNGVDGHVIDTGLHGMGGNDVGSFVSYLKKKYNSGSTQNHIGAAFIYNTILGNPPRSSTTVKDGDWANLLTTLTNFETNGGKIDWSSDTGPCGQWNSYYQGDTLKDDAFYNNTTYGCNDKSVEFSIGGNVVYMLDWECANPFGSMQGISGASGNPCRPILIAVIPADKQTIPPTYPMTYPAKSYNSHGFSAYTPPTLVPIKVTSSEGTIGKYRSPVLIPPGVDITRTHTTGDKYTIKYTETETYNNSGKHVSGYSDNYTVIYVGGWENKCTGKGINRVCNQVWNKRHSSYKEYHEPNINYAGPTTWTTTVGPCYDYKLTPDINALSTYRVEPGATVTVKPKLDSSSSKEYKSYLHTKSKDTKWQVLRLKVNPNTTINKDNKESNSNPCDYYTSIGGVSDCTVMDSGTDVISTSGKTFSNYNGGSTDELAGTKICYALSVFPSSSEPINYSSSTAGSKWMHSGLNTALGNSCLILVKAPKAQVLGGDLSVGGSTQTTVSVKSGNYFGSWAEYGIFAGQTIINTASGSAYSPKTGLPAGLLATKSNILSFANAGVTNSCALPGCYSVGRTLPNVAASFPSTNHSLSPGSTVTTSNLASDTYDVAGNLSLNASTLPAGRSIIIKATGTVTINGSQTYSNGPYKSISQLPQLIIIANRIVINNSATQVDAWLVAYDANLKNGSIDTCEKVGQTINDCNSKLTVNGPVMTDHLYLYRTAGSEPGDKSGDPAEVFNIRPDTYLWAASRSIGVGVAQTVSTTDVPPRN